MNIEDVLSDPALMKAINSTLNAYNYIDRDELDSIKLVTIWECLQKFDPEKASLKTYICQNLVFKVKKYLHKNKRDKKNLKKYAETNTGSYFEPNEDIFDCLPDEYKDIMIKKYIHKMTYKEIGKEYGMHYNTIWKKVDFAKSIILSDL